MKNSDVLRSVRYMMKVNDQKMAEIANLADAKITSTQMEQYLKDEEEPGSLECPGKTFSQFLNGLIYFKRGKDPLKPALTPSLNISNNLVLKKLKVAFSLKDDEMIEIFKLGAQEISKSELGALLRADDHQNYRLCQDQYLRKFLKGLTVKLRG